MSQFFQYFGVYAILVKEGKLLLTLKKKGPYKGMWDLPGGGMEEGEKVEETLVRELREEVALLPLRFSKIQEFEAKSRYEESGQEYRFYHHGVIFEVHQWEELQGEKEEEDQWILLSSLEEFPLSAFAKQAVQYVRGKLS